MSKERIIDAELVDGPPRGRREPAEAHGEAAPLHIELFAWPKLLRARAVITERGKRRYVALDGSLLLFVLNYFNAIR